MAAHCGFRRTETGKMDGGEPFLIRTDTEGQPTKKLMITFSNAVVEKERHFADRVPAAAARTIPEMEGKMEEGEGRTKIKTGSKKGRKKD